MRHEKLNSENEETRKNQGKSFFDPELAAVKTDHQKSKPFSKTSTNSKIQ